MKSMDIYNSATQTHRQRAVPVRPHRCRPRFSSHSNLKSESWSLIHTETSPIICQSLHNAMRFWNDLLLSALLMQSVFLQNTLSSIPFHQQQYATLNLWKINEIHIPACVTLQAYSAKRSHSLWQQRLFIWSQSQAWQLRLSCAVFRSSHRLTATLSSRCANRCHASYLQVWLSHRLPDFVLIMRGNC